ncbi:hypothetical protein EHQ92_09450 [Leptospira biflexa]|uniref:hypothetical protein n=1 Tax=Leptospira biflexa TaxID=172 RepID=UPI001091576B|nr:hypothetical protein [Leptospira biflexa]TGM48099.1 hypothetical protein EHQ92_09450 [Leptospira biflexa]TGM49437.1 hypothetical protein EHQ88_03630 [Leptospira biflexa]
MMLNGQGADLSLLIWNSSISILVFSLVCYLATFRQTVLFTLVITLSLLVTIQFSFQPSFDSISIMGFSKLMLLLPLGLGVILGFGLFSESIQKRHLPLFTRYINFAVLANIFAMMFSPSGDTYRGVFSRFTCFTLLIWLVQEMAKVNFQTTHMDSKMFLFRSSPLHWIYCHAAYRMALLSLPTFASIRFILLEPFSLIAMVALYHWHNKRYPLYYYFGFADTIAVTTLTVLARYPVLPPFPSKGPYFPNLQEYQWDMVFLPIQFLVTGFALWAIFQNLSVKRSIPI